MATAPDTADAAAAGPPEPVAEQKKDKAAPPRDDSLWQSLVILGWGCTTAKALFFSWLIWTRGLFSVPGQALEPTARGWGVRACVVGLQCQQVRRPPLRAGAALAAAPTQTTMGLHPECRRHCHARACKLQTFAALTSPRSRSNRALLYPQASHLGHESQAARGSSSSVKCRASPAVRPLAHFLTMCLSPSTLTRRPTGHRLSQHPVLLRR